MSPRRAPPPIDWAEVHRRMDRLREAVERGWAPDPGETAQILEQRAASLARPVAAGGEPGQGIEVIEFGLCGERYALESEWVREVFPLTELTPLPCTPAFVAGIVSVRGEIVSVIDLRRFFGLSAAGLADLNRVIILEAPAMVFGVLADHIAGVSSLPLAHILPPPAGLQGVGADYLRGITAQRLVVLDARRLLEGGDLVVREDVRES